MIFTEEALVFQVAGEHLLGIVAKPDFPVDYGVLIVVGGPQYRAGSHRQFLLLSRRLATEGYPAMRFDYRGMGDSGGAMREFDAVCEDIEAAVNAFQLACPKVKRVVLWGLCDAASAALLYVQATRDLRIAGLILLNPWVRSVASLAQTHIKHYYGQRLLQKVFWIKLLSGKMQVMKSLQGFLNSLLQARGKPLPTDNVSRSFQDLMAEGLKQFPGGVLLILSGQDYTAREFVDYVGSNAAWKGLTEAVKVTRIEVEDADHTFSSRVLRLSVEDATIAWLVNLQSI
ncbi:MAG: hydrolase 1, exosortase A system-associated [Propionivibrio sp.]|uniref:hydrolase 1, exosortase A system-associated n=1 Tax=Propionivibrio sp. TaxID=2212460 RepID=UPI001A621CE5|nr:hydrolase 1, exosortase A system-associated [Propionivibrio sp.]MBL8413606.1 hydrolase 1, exosortase A system-associated [Propionivibrio sp.]